MVNKFEAVIENVLQPDMPETIRSALQRTSVAIFFLKNLM